MVHEIQICGLVKLVRCFFFLFPLFLFSHHCCLQFKLSTAKQNFRPFSHSKQRRKQNTAKGLSQNSRFYNNSVYVLHLLPGISTSKKLYFRGKKGTWIPSHMCLVASFVLLEGQIYSALFLFDCWIIQHMLRRVCQVKSRRQNLTTYCIKHHIKLNTMYQGR